MNEECPDECSCWIGYVIRTGNDVLLPLVSVDCRHRGLATLPATLPHNTTTLYAQGNQVTSRLPPGGGGGGALENASLSEKEQKFSTVADRGADASGRGSGQLRGRQGRVPGRQRGVLGGAAGRDAVVVILQGVESPREPADAVAHVRAAERPREESQRPLPPPRPQPLALRLRLHAGLPGHFLKYAFGQFASQVTKYHCTSISTK